MPIEIRELHIKTVIEDSNGKERSMAEGSSFCDEKEQIIAECIERILDILNAGNER